ncbi:Uncharacterised protein [Starkeya nomas]|uniref:Conjugal transfer protein TraH n=1 Tax=Starkeya nomas TaxID=2666134 RepID=A0A5S9NHT3_9HYPH|nr:conjugal transfer protein TraH [Starkeya nomas]CAA0090097.1 Uncharacterised protein [Starkeya nomas]
MVDAALIQQCADPNLKPAIVEKFIEQVGMRDPLAVTVRAGDLVVLVPKPGSPAEALALIREHVGRYVVRVGVTQFPAGLGVQDVAELTSDLVDPCANIRMGSALFRKVYAMVVRWYGRETDEALEDAILAWKSGYFEGDFVFTATELPPDGSMPHTPPETTAEEADREGSPSEPPAGDPNGADIRIDLSRIGVKPSMDRK